MELINEIKHEKRYIVAILDLLGASDRIEHGDSEGLLNVIIYTFEHTKKYWTQVEHAPLTLRDIECVTFSDNIAIALELPESLPGDEVMQRVNDFILYISVFQGAGLANCLWFRGGISIGKLYIDPKNNYIWGKALVKAHKLETEAIYPRVILDSEVEKIIFPEETRIKVDKDNRYFVDYITTIRSLHSEWIDKNKEMIDRDKGSVDDKKVLDKFQWFLQQID